MNIPSEIWNEAQKRGLDWICTGGGCDYIFCRTIKGKYYNCQLTLDRHGVSPTNLKESCEVGVALHSTGRICIGIPFKNVIDALDFMQTTKGVYFIEDQYKYGKEDPEGLNT